VYVWFKDRHSWANGCGGVQQERVLWEGVLTTAHVRGAAGLVRTSEGGKVWGCVAKGDGPLERLDEYMTFEELWMGGMQPLLGGNGVWGKARWTTETRGAAQGRDDQDYLDSRYSGAPPEPSGVRQ
jgi:hypothetical protein